MHTALRSLRSHHFFALVAFVFTTLWSGGGSPALAQLIPQTQLSVAGVDSEQSAVYAASKSIDGNAKTMWHTQWSPTVAPFPHQLTLRLASSYIVTGLRYLPRQDGSLYGIITAYAVYVSTDGVTWGTPVASGTWPGTSAQKEISFAGKEGRYVRLVATAAASTAKYRGTYTSAAEINLLGTLVPTPPPVPTVRTLTWLDSATNEDGFNIERKAVGTTGFVRLTVVGANTTSYQDTQIQSGVTYCYRIQAFNTVGLSPFSNEACTLNQSAAPATQVSSSSLTTSGQVSGALRQRLGTSGISPQTPKSSSTDSSAETRQTVPVQIGVFRQRTATWYLDRNGNGKLDDCIVDACPATFGVAGDRPVIGDWDGSGMDRLGVFSPATQMWDLDKNGNTIWEACDYDLCQGPFGMAADIPLSGRWRVGSKAATIGVYRPWTGQWILDLDGDGRLRADDTHLGPFGEPSDLPVVGDWTGTGETHIGTFNPQTGEWRLDLNGNGTFDGCTIDRCARSFSRKKSYPVVGDWTGTGETHIGTFNPQTGEWRLDLNGNGTFDGCTIDRCAGPFGRAGDLPIVGRW